MIFQTPESNPSSAGSSPSRNPARMLTGMSCCVTSPMNKEDTVEKKSGARPRKGSQNAKQRNDFMRDPSSRSARSEKWCRMRLPTQVSAFVAGRVSKKSPLIQSISADKFAGRPIRSKPVTLEEGSDALILRQSSPSPAPSSRMRAGAGSCFSSWPTIHRELPRKKSIKRRSLRLLSARGSEGSSESKISGTMTRSSFLMSGEAGSLADTQKIIQLHLRRGGIEVPTERAVSNTQRVFACDERLYCWKVCNRMGL